MRCAVDGPGASFGPRNDDGLCQVPTHGLPRCSADLTPDTGLPTDPAPPPMPDADTLTLSHVDDEGRARMVDVSAKSPTARTAVARGRVLIGEEAFRLVREKGLRKGDVLTVAQVAGILGAKQTSRLIPLCHDVLLEGVDLDFELNEADLAVEVRAYVKTTGPTGVEMEALTAVSVAALTIYDMCKSVSKDVTITDVQLLAKTGGQSGDYRRSG